MRRWAHLGLVAAVALAPLLQARAEKRGDALPPSVSAREAAARARSARASALYDAGKYDDALRLFLAAYDLAPLSDILFNIGLAREKMLDYEGCVRDFRRYVREGKDPNLQSRAGERLAHCAATAQLAMRATSIPPGAAITISEPGADAHPRFLGRTPVEAKLALGTYVVRAELPGYETAEQRLGVDVDQQRDVDFPMRKLASLSVDADSPGATAQIGNDEAAPLPLHRELPAGPYKVMVTKPGHQTVTRAVTLGVGEQSTLVVALPALPQIRALTLNAEAAASLSVDGVHVGERRVALEQGSHHVEVSAPAARPYVGDVTIPANRDVTLAVTLGHERSWRKRASIIALGGLALGAAIAGTIQGVQALDDHSRYADTPSLRLADEGHGHAVAADVLFGTALVLAGAAIVTYFVTAPDESKAVQR